MNKKDLSKQYGMKAENFFASLLNQKGMQYEFVDKWFDFLVSKKFKVEVKSTQLSIANGNRKFKAGRFDFTQKENREMQFKENIWVALILRHEGEFLFLGFVQARQLKKKRYLCLNNLRTLKIIDLEQWLIKINSEEENGN